MSSEALIDPAAIRAFDERAGYELVSYREVALPVFLLSIDVLVLDERPLPPIQEFVLGTVETGLDQVASIAGLLGIDESVVVSSASDLQMDDSVFLSSGPDGRHRLELTHKGRDTLETLRSVRQDF